MTPQGPGLNMHEGDRPMTFSQRCAVHLVPLLARLVLAIAFIPWGWGQLMHERSFGAEDAATLRALGIGRDETVVVSSEPAPDSASEVTPPAIGERPLTAAALHSTTAAAERAGLIRPTIYGWSVALVALLGGVSLLIGLLTRLGALGLALVSGLLFWLTAWPSITGAGTLFPPQPTADHAIALLALFVLALGILLVGPGAASLDRAIFRRATPIDEV
jgi:uncharacterized membrane protein YphA (DoxX/SURF4 family)